MKKHILMSLIFLLGLAPLTQVNAAGCSSSKGKKGQPKSKPTPKEENR